MVGKVFLKFRPNLLGRKGTAVNFSVDVVMLIQVVQLQLKDQIIVNRDEAASELELFDEPVVEAVLIKVGMETNLDTNITDTIGESLAGIWCRKGKFDREVYEKLHPKVKIMAKAILGSVNPYLFK